MTTLSYGYLLPQNTDTGDEWFSALEFDIQRLNDHTHNGTNSAPIAKSTASLPSGSWIAAPIGGGLYYQDYTFSNPFNYDSFLFDFRLSTGELVFPTVERLASNQIRVYTNDNSKTYTMGWK